MVKNKIGLLYILFLICAVNFVCQAEIVPPLKRSLQLTGNFGELRTNHFHTGLDFRASIGTPVYAVDSGYVSRITVSAGGYGNALYITHPSGITSVYAHLNAFAPKIEETLKQYQMQLKYYAVDLSFSPTDIQVEREEIVAYTGNRGSSGGPHLHFEIRDTQTQNPLEPLYYLKDKIKDTRSPKIKAISIMPYRGVVNNANIQTIKVEKNSVVPQIKAWGDLILAVEAYDYMDGMRNIYGVHYVNLYKDEELIYSSYIDTLSFDKGRQINTYINSEQFLKDKSLYMQSFIAPGNTLPFYEKNNISNNGVVTIDEERVYKFRYEVFDYYGNKDEYAFEIVGENIECKPIEQEYVEYNEEYIIEEENFRMTIPAYALYDNYIPQYSKSDTLKVGNYSQIHTIEPYYAGVDKNCKLSIKIDVDTIQDKSKYYIVSINSVGKKKGKVSQEYISEYSDGWLITQVKTFGQFVVKADQTKPYIKYHGVVDGEIRFTVKDDESGLKYFKGEVDGEFVVFTYDMKDKIARYKIDTKKFEQGSIHTLKFEAIDNCGNEKLYHGNLRF